jgi:hypothetical protein
MHWPEVGIGEGFIEDCLDAVFAEGAHERMGDGDFPQSINCCGPGDHALADQVGEAPALPPELGQLRIGDGLPCFEQFVVLAGHAALLLRALANAIWRERTQLRTSGVGSIASGVLLQAGHAPNFSLYLCAIHPR